MSFALINLLTAAGRADGWEQVTVTAALNEAARRFDIVVSEVGPFGDSPFVAWPFPPGLPVAVTANGLLLVEGFVDSYAPQATATAHSVTISGRGKSCDFVDCSSWHPTGRFDDKRIEEIAAELAAPFGLSVAAEVDTGVPVPEFQVRQGASPLSELLPLLHQRRLTVKGTADGNLAITRAGVGHHAGGLVQGVNIEKMGGRLDHGGRHSDYVVKGQAARGWQEPQLRVRGEARDPAVQRFRPRIIIDPADTDRQRATDRALWEAKRAAGFSVKATIDTPSFQDAGGRLWEPGWTVAVHAPFLKIEQDMLIERVEFRQDNGGGTMASLGLVDPKAYDGQDAGGNSGDVWRIP